MTQTLFVELNEINFESIRVYTAQGKLPTFSALLRDYDLVETMSESEYENIEPWIQWVTAHTGMALSEHGVFRLGDILDHELDQIWEELEKDGLKVGAVSPMNAKNRTSNAAYFVPDPWTRTGVTGTYLTKQLYAAIAQAVNDNTSAQIASTSVFWLLIGALRFARIENYGRYLNLAFSARTKPWTRAMFLDLLLADLFIKLTARSKPDFTTLFLNAGAHIQHHYMFSSTAYSGNQSNPEWYISPRFDPVLEVYELYDLILSQIVNQFPDARLMVATGLHQDPHPELTFYWRLNNHKSFLEKRKVPFTSVEPKMSRDFHVRCSDSVQAREAESLLAQMRDLEGIPLFEVDNRGSDLFVMLTYPRDIPKDFKYVTTFGEIDGLRDDVAFVAIKNGQHNGIGYFIDTGSTRHQYSGPIPLSDMPSIVRGAVFAS